MTAGAEPELGLVKRELTLKSEFALGLMGVSLGVGDLEDNSLELGDTGLVVLLLWLLVILEDAMEDEEGERESLGADGGLVPPSEFDSPSPPVPGFGRCSGSNLMISHTFIIY